MPRQVITILLFFFAKAMSAQTCTNTGQTPASAIFVCGSGVFVQNTVPTCGNISILVPCVNSGNFYINRNPVWFRFACFSSGTLGFTITPLDASENFDWQLFDKTNRNPEDIFTNPELFVACNWSGDIGETGASAEGTSLTVCNGVTDPLFTSMPTLIQGHEYLLMISHFNSSSNGFMLEFTNGAFNITDPVEPYLKSVRTSCDGSKVIVKLNAKIRCNTLAADGSDFSISPSGSISSATAFSCASKPDTDSVVLFLNNPLMTGNYTVSVKNGSDGNTLMDNCNRFMASGTSIPLPVTALQSTPLDSITKPFCKPSKLELVFSRPIQCNSIAADGSDFMISGPQGVAVSGVNFDCGINSSTQVITLELASPITTGGTYNVRLNTGSDGNTLIDECGNHTPPSSKNILVMSDADATFAHTIKAGCKKDTIYFSHNGANGINNWLWKFDNTITSILQNPVQIYPASGHYTVQLTVSNGSCSNTVTKDIVLDNEVVADFETLNIICPEDGLTLQNKTRGDVINWLWNFGDGNISTDKDPSAYYFNTSGREMIYTVKLIAVSSFGCSDSISRQVKVLGSCFIAVPTAFSPNNDGLNDFLYPLNALKADNLDFRIFNRSGSLLFASRDWQKKWDGKFRSIPMPPGIYVWTLRYTHHDTGQKHELKGTVMLVR